MCPAAAWPRHRDRRKIAQQREGPFELLGPRLHKRRAISERWRAPSGSHAAAAVDVECVAGEVVGAVRGKEHGERAGVVLRVPQPAERDIGQRVLVVLGVGVEEFLGPLGEHPGDNAIDRDVVLGPFASRGTG